MQGDTMPAFLFLLHRGLAARDQLTYLLATLPADLLVETFTIALFGGSPALLTADLAALLPISS